MLLFDFHAIGNKLLTYRKKTGMTQAEVAEAAGVSDRTYADIERGTVNMRVETLLRICQVLSITPNDVLTENPTGEYIPAEQLLLKLNACNPRNRQTAMQLLEVFLDSLP